MEKPKDFALRSGLITKDLSPAEYKRVKLEGLLKEEEKLMNWRLYLKPSANLKVLNLGKKISKLDPQREAPQIQDYISTAIIEIGRAAIYASPLIYAGVELYKKFH